MNWIPSLVSALVSTLVIIVGVVGLGWLACARLCTKFDAMREEMRTGFRELIRATGVSSERVDAGDARSESVTSTVGLLHASALGVSTDPEGPATIIDSIADIERHSGGRVGFEQAVADLEAERIPS